MLPEFVKLGLPLELVQSTVWAFTAVFKVVASYRASVASDNFSLGTRRKITFRESERCCRHGLKSFDCVTLCLDLILDLSHDF